jgi:hypothetical protein
MQKEANAATGSQPADDNKEEVRAYISSNRKRWQPQAAILLIVKNSWEPLYRQKEAEVATGGQPADNKEAVRAYRLCGRKWRQQAASLPKVRRRWEPT